MVTEQQITEMAYGIWEGEGGPDGKDQEHYFRAKLILEQREKSSPVKPIAMHMPKFQRREQDAQLAPPVVDLPPGQYKHRRYNEH